MQMTYERLGQFIGKILAYNWEDEMKDFSENHKTDKGTHIFRTMVELDNFLYGTQRSPESYV